MSVEPGPSPTREFGPESATLDAPTFRPPVATAGRLRSAPIGPPLAPGDCLDDYEIVRTLGEGSFARVYLARQVSLDRRVALKVSADQGGEARTMAALEHSHVVQVFGEAVVAVRGLRLVCMQFVPGLTLEHVIAELALRPPERWTGRTVLEILDASSAEAPALDPGALHDREALAASDFTEAVCWLGARLADALAYAHRRGVLHLDVKPANILLNQYGRPFLADFNIARDGRKGTACERFGGTLPYMAPEHLRAFDPADTTPADAVDHRADVYALGLVLFELLAGRRAFRDDGDGSGAGSAPAELAAKRVAVPSVREARPQAPEALDRVLRRCLDPSPDRRYGSAGELAEALEGCRQLRRVENATPRPGAWGRLVVAYPLAALIVLSLLPHFLGSAVNITYNRLSIVGELSPGQQGCFLRLVVAYNAVVYPVCVGLLCRLVVPVFRTWRRLRRAEPVPDEQITRARRDALRLPLWATVLSCAGWLPGGFFFPAALSLLAGPLGAADFGHFLISFTVAGLIAMAYSFFGVEYVVLCALYPRLWADARHLKASAEEELRGRDGRLRFFQFLAGLVPVSGAALLVCSGPEQLTVSYRLLVTALLGLGLAGLGVAVLVSARLSATLAAWARAG
jgi:serine/threonine protein kinase